MEVNLPASVSCSRTCCGCCYRFSHDILHRSRNFQVVEESMHGDDSGGSTSNGKMETSFSRTSFSVHTRSGCTWRPLFASPWASLTGSWLHGSSCELGPDKGYLSESLFTFIFLSFVLWTFNPFVYHSKRFYTVLLWRRVLAFLVTSQILRIVTFYSTQLPGPNYHCREGSKLARLPPPDTVFEVLLINFPRGVLYGCGDLIFSSHMIFTLVFVNTYQKYGSKRFIKFLAWVLVIIQSLLIIAARKHYSVDIVVAWYTVNLVVFLIDKKLPEMPERTSGALSLLPLSVKEKDGRQRDEKPNKILGGNAGDNNADWRQRTQMNGKHGEEGNIVNTDVAANVT